MSKFTKFWRQLKPGQKQRAVLMLILIGIILFSLWAFQASRSPELIPNTSEKKREISLDPKVLEKTMIEESKKATREQNEKILKLTKEIDALKREEKNPDRLKKVSKLNDLPIPPPNRLKVPPPPQPMMPSKSSPPSAALRETIGGISVVSNPFAGTLLKNDEIKKKEPNHVYLPPSFMEATLLTGLDAETVESAKGQPEPVLLRIKDLAVLPNRIKANLKGCFVIAHGYGKLSKERVMLRLVTLSCLAKDGQAVIDQPIKGFVADEDGKNGLRGNVVSRMGASVAYATLAGFAGGAGDAFTTASSTTTTSPLGSTGIIAPKDFGKAVIGGGLSGGSKEIQRLFLDLARQATPIIEIGATKTVTLIITEGVDLEIKETCIGGATCID